MNVFLKAKNSLRTNLIRASYYSPSQRFNLHGVISYSQEGEDRILLRLFEHQSAGFFIDVGAHHPIRFSNTYAFYRRGWTGINIEPRPGSMMLFQKFRPNDISLEIGVADTNGTMIYHQFDEPALNSFDPAMAEEHSASGRYHIINKQPVPVKPLKAILDEHLPPGTPIDFMNVDVEGLDMAVIASNDWSRYRPRVVLAESLGMGINEVISSPLCDYMVKQGYGLYAKTCHTTFYKNQEPD